MRKENTMQEIEKKNGKRLFVAVDMPENVQQEVRKIQKALQKEPLFKGRFVKPENVHITVKFIGEVSNGDIENIEVVLRQIKAKKMEAYVGGVDVFTSRGRIKIIYLRVICQELADLAAQIEHALMPWCKKEERDFVSHATLARVKKVENKQELLDAVQNLSIEPVPFIISSFVLKESVLLPEGPEYTTLFTFPLSD